MPRPSLSLSVVGAQFPNRRGPTRLFELALCKPGDPIELRREPKNKADERAVAVYSSRGVQLGYLTAERAPTFSAALANGREVQAIFQRKTEWGAVIRVAFDGEHPVLPPARPRTDTRDDPDFYPDEIYPDE